MKNPDRVIKEAIKDAQHTLAEYVHPGERNAEDTVEALLTTLDDNDVNEAILGSDRLEKRKCNRGAGPANRIVVHHK